MNLTNERNQASGGDVGSWLNNGIQTATPWSNVVVEHLLQMEGLLGKIVYESVVDVYCHGWLLEGRCDV